MNAYRSLLVLLSCALGAQLAGAAEGEPFVQVKVADGVLTKLDVPPQPGLFGVYEAPDARLVVIAVPEPRRLKLTEGMKKAFVQGLSKGGIIVVKGEQQTTFQGLEAYRFAVGIRQAGTEIPAVVIYFVANGFAYQLQVLGPTGELKEASLASVLQRVSLTKTEQHLALPAGSAKPDPVYAFSERMGRIAGLCFLAIIAILAFKLIRRKMKTT